MPMELKEQHMGFISGKATDRTLAAGFG